MLTDFFDMWNVNIDIQLQGIDKKYHGLFEGHILEGDIEKMMRWSNQDEPPHPDWVLMRNVEDSNETFGFIEYIPPNVTDEDDDSASDDSLYNLASNVAYL